MALHVPSSSSNVLKCVIGLILENADAYFLKYVIPTNLKNYKKPVFISASCGPICARVPGVFPLPLVMNSACWKKNLKNVALPIPLKKEV